MAGEMFASDVTREAWPLHFAIADAFNGTVKPFDQYQGPYVSIGEDIRVGNDPYAYAPRIPGIVRLWIITEEGEVGQVYNEDNEKTSSPFFFYTNSAESDAVDAAREVLDNPSA